MGVGRVSSLRPVIVGMNNPVSALPEHALYPLPHGCAGNRLWQMLSDETGATMRDYMRSFERVNVLTGKWIKLAARESAVDLRRRYAGRTLLLLGRDVQDAFGAPRDIGPFAGWAVDSLRSLVTCFYLVPHPSGRNLWYNDPVNRKMVATLLGQLYRDYVESVRCA